MKHTMRVIGLRSWDHSIKKQSRLNFVIDLVKFELINTDEQKKGYKRDW